METTNQDACRKRNGKETSFEFKIAVIAEIANGQISANFASKKYNISRSTIAYWQKKLSNYIVEKKFKSKEDEIKALRGRIYDLEGIKDFQQDIIIEFERVTGKELSKKFLPEKLANEIQKKKKKLKD
jgi:transposase-like protein